MDEDLDIGRRSWIKATQPIQQDAYREGFDCGRNAQFQEGFDIGYIAGFQNGFKMGLVNATCRVAKEVGREETVLSGIEPFDQPHRGQCALCPSANEELTKIKMAEISSKIYSLEEALGKQERNNIPKLAVEAVSSLLGI